MFGDEFFSVGHIFSARNSACPITGLPVGASVGQDGFQIFRGRQLLSQRAAEQAAPAELHRFVLEMNSGDPVSPGETNYAIVESAAAPNTQCGRDF